MAAHPITGTVYVQAPGRINIIGEHTDYNGGFVMPAAIDKAIWLAAGKRNDGRFAFFAHDLGDFFVGQIGNNLGLSGSALEQQHEQGQTIACSFHKTALGKYWALTRAFPS